MEDLKQKYLAISGQWNGKESGLSEDRAHSAQDIVDLIDEIEREKEEHRNLAEQITKDELMLQEYIKTHEENYA